jgi:centractin
MTSGVVLDCGDGVCHSTAVFEGYSISNATNRIDIGGRDVTQRLQMLMRRSGYAFHTSSEFEIVRKIKETHCMLNTSSKQAMGADNTSEPINYKMPDGSEIKLKQEV